MRTLDRYVFREVAWSWAAVTGVLLVILVGNQLAQVLGQAAERGYPREVILGLIGLTSIQNLTVLVPVGLLIGIVLALGRLHHESEMAALRACGVGPVQLLRPIARLAVVVTAVLAWLALVGAPAAFDRAQQVRRDALRAAEFGLLEPGKFHSFAGGTAVFYAEARDPNGDLRRVFLQRRVRERIEVALADRAEHRVEEHGTLHVLVLIDGDRYEGAPGQAAMRRVHFAEHTVPVRVGEQELGPARVETRSLVDLATDPAPAARAELQWRVSLPLMALILTVLAVPLAQLRPRQGRYGRIGVAILVYFVYSNLLSAARVWIEKGWLAPELGLWWTHAAVLAIALALLWRQSPPHWTTR